MVSPADVLDSLLVVGGDAPTVDLGGCTWITSLHLAATAALAHAHARTGTPLRVVAPAGLEHRRYASRMHLGRQLDALGVAHDFPAVGERVRSGDLLEVREVASTADAHALAALLADTLRPTSPDGAQVLFAGVAELAENVALHSGATGFVVAQTYRRSGTVRFAVADAGIGVRASLSPRGRFTDATALTHALDGLSRLRHAHGQGLRSTRTTLLGLGGTLFLASGGASRHAGPHGDTPHEHARAFPGTALEGSFPLP